jgi:hypothetical protein
MTYEQFFVERQQGASAAGSGAAVDGVHTGGARGFS